MGHWYNCTHTNARTHTRTSISSRAGWTAVVSEDGHTHIWRNACVGGLLSAIKIGRLTVEVEWENVWWYTKDGSWFLFMKSTLTCIRTNYVFSYPPPQHIHIYSDFFFFFPLLCIRSSQDSMHPSKSVDWMGLAEVLFITKLLLETHFVVRTLTFTIIGVRNLLHYWIFGTLFHFLAPSGVAACSRFVCLSVPCQDLNAQICGCLYIDTKAELKHWKQ